MTCMAHWLPLMPIVKDDILRRSSDAKQDNHVRGDGDGVGGVR
jgi:hypothetical protein